MNGELAACAQRPRLARAHVLAASALLGAGMLALALPAEVGSAQAAEPAAASARPQRGPVPWPRGQAPTPAALDALVSDALELFELERAEEFLEATEIGEESEHTFVLQEKIDAGAFTVEQLFAIGDATFEHEFRKADGLGASRDPRAQLVHFGAAGGLDGLACAGCHAVGGVNGAGTPTSTAFYFGDGETTSSALKRNPPAVLGLGYVQQLGREMTRRLRGLRDQAVARALASGKAQEVALEAKGVRFGTLRVQADGQVDTRAVEGVDADLQIKPFGWKGHTADLRRFAERAARIHFGIQSHPLTQQHRTDPDPGLLGWGRHWWDPDADGRQREMEEGTLSALALYMALLEVPQLIPPHDAGLRERWARGGELFDRIGCSDCHRRVLAVTSMTVHEKPDTTLGAGIRFRLNSDGEAPRADGEKVMLFSDLKRHAMGPELADPRGTTDGIAADQFITRPLWGLAESAPYLHDGRAVTIPAAILAHGGEAATQRANFASLAVAQQGDLHLFLLSLTREPKLRVAR